MEDITENICAAVTEELVKEFLKTHYGFINGKIRQLDGYDDKNYQVTEVEKCIGGIEFPDDGVVIKFINTIDSKNLKLLEAQTKLTQHLKNNGINCPVPVLNKCGQSYQTLVIDKKKHVVRVYKYIAGETMNKISINSDVLTDFGSYIGRLSLVFKTFYHEGFLRDQFMWALEKSPEVLRFVDIFNEEKQRQTITKVLNKFQSDVLLKSDHLEKSVIHGDINANNIIINNNKVLGIIDFGDVLYSYTIFEFSIALCYLILHEFEDDNGKLSNLHIKSFLNAYEKQYRNFSDSELSIIHTCVCARICQSLVLGKKSSLRDPSNLYVLSTQKTGWKALEELMNVQDDKFIKLFKY